MTPPPRSHTPGLEKDSLCSFTIRAISWLFALCLTTALGQATAAPNWEQTIVAEDRKLESRPFNVPHLVLDRQGDPHVVYVRKKPGVDTLLHATIRNDQWRSEPIWTMRHSNRHVSGIASYALAISRRNRMHLFLYTRDYPDSGLITEERWARRSTCARSWRMRVIRHDVQQRGGAGVFDPHIAIDSRSRLHLAAYVHNAYGAGHRVRHRYFDGQDFPINTVPLPPGKAESKVVNLCIDNQDVVHFVYNATRPTRRRNPDPLYPDSDLAYVSRRGANWSSPEIVRAHLGDNPSETDIFVLSVGIGLDPQGNLVLVYATSRWKAASPMRVYCVRNQNAIWKEQLVAVVTDPASRTPELDLSCPAFDQQGRVYFAGCDGTRTIVFAEQPDQWRQTMFPGKMQGFGIHDGKHAHLLISQDRRLIHFSQPNLR